MKFSGANLMMGFSKILKNSKISITFLVIVIILIIIAFNYFYLSIQYNPVEIANNIKNNGGTIPGIRPGKPTSDFIINDYC